MTTKGKENTPEENLDPDPLAEIQARQERLKAEAAAEIAKLDEERIRLNEQRRPLAELNQKRELISAQIQRVIERRPEVVADATQWRLKVAQLFESESAPQLNVFTLTNAWPHLPLAELTLSEIDRWLTGKKAELAEVEREIGEMAEKQGLQGLLTSLGLSRLLRRR